MCLTFGSLVSRSVPLLKRQILTLIQLCAYQTFEQQYLVGFCICKSTSPLIERASVLDLRKIAVLWAIGGGIKRKVLPEPSEWRQAYTSTFVLPSLNIDPACPKRSRSVVCEVIVVQLPVYAPAHHPQMYQNLNVNCMSSGPRQLEFRQVRRKASSHCQSLMIFLHWFWAWWMTYNLQWLKGLERALAVGIDPDS
jgi:hypothetical protein